MKVEFRQRTPVEYANILWRRKWLLLLPTIAVFFAVGIVVWRLPDVYQSSTLLIVRPPVIYSNVVPKLSNEDLSIRINNIGQKVVSRSTLEPMINRYDLYRSERARGEPMDLLVERMRTRDIGIQINNSRNDVTNGFNIFFKAPRADVAQQVTSELAGMYITEEVSSSGNIAEMNKKLIDEQAELAKQALEEIDNQRLAYKGVHTSSLPDQAGALLSRLTNLYDQQKSYMEQISRTKDQRAIWETQLGDIKDQLEQDVLEVKETFADPKTTPQWADLSRRQTELETNLEQMYANGLRPKNPDVITVKQLLAKIKIEKDALVEEQQSKVAEKEKRLERRVNSDSRIKNFQYNLDYQKNELERQEKALAETRAQISELEGRINNVPETQVGLERLDREFGMRKQSYDQLLDKKRQVDLGNVVAVNSQGESIQVLDPANLPSQPIAPKRPMLLGLGLAAGLGLGLLLAIGAEVPRLLTVQSVEDARHYTNNLPVLITVPTLLTPREQRRQRIRRTALALAGITITVVSIPALALLIRMTHVLDRFAS